MILLKGSIVKRAMYAHLIPPILSVPFLQRKMLLFFFQKKVRTSDPCPDLSLLQRPWSCHICTKLLYPPWSGVVGAHSLAPFPGLRMTTLSIVMLSRYRSALSLVLDKITSVVKLAKNSQPESPVTPGLYPPLDRVHSGSPDL